MNDSAYLHDLCRYAMVVFYTLTFSEFVMRLLNLLPPPYSCEKY